MLGFGGLEGKFTQEKCRGPDWVQNADMHFARTCTVEMHVQMTLYGKLMEKCRGPDWAQNADTHTHTLCASLRNRNACPHVTRDVRRVTLYRRLQEKCRGPDWAQNADTHSVRACAVEMCVHMSQEPSEEPLFKKECRNHAAAQIGPRTRTHTLCEAAQSKCMSKCHKRHQKSHFIRAQNADTHFVRACAVETHVKTSQEPLNTEIYRKNCRGPE